MSIRLCNTIKTVSLHKPVIYSTNFELNTVTFKTFFFSHHKKYAYNQVQGKDIH